MATAAKNTFQNYDPRHRLTGAVVLILLAIVLLPMLLGKKTEPAHPVVDSTDPVVMEVTSEGKKVFVSRISSVAEKPIKSDEKKNTVNSDSSSTALIAPISPAKTIKAKSSQKPEKKSAPTVTKSPAKTAITKKPVSKTKSTTKTTSKSSKNSKSSATTAGNWILQVGVFSQAANANKKVAELKKKGFSARSGKVKTSKGNATKVWIGPYKNRKSAENMQDRLLHKTRQRGIVVKMKP